MSDEARQYDEHSQPVRSAVNAVREIVAENERLKSELAEQVAKRKEFVRTVADAVKLDLSMFTANRVLQEAADQRAELERLRASNQRLEVEAIQRQGESDRARLAARADIERLQARVARYEAASGAHTHFSNDFSDALDSIYEAQQHPEGAALELDQAREKIVEMALIFDSVLHSRDELRARVAELEAVLNLGTKVYLEQKSEIEHLRTGSPMTDWRGNEIES